MNLFDLYVKRKIPEEVYQFQKKILHITDTPDITYPYIKRLLKILKPDIVIHTGDLVDNIKLEISRSDIANYEKRVHTLLKLMRMTGPDEIHICLGNHDDEKIIRKYLSTNEYLHKKVILNVLDKRLLLAHAFIMRTNEPVDFFLYGHSPEHPSNMKGTPICLNGMDNIYVMDALTGKVISIPYPKDTDYFRQKKFKLGF